MGFRDFGCFNSALIVKQLWRILTRPSSLATTIMEEKYFKFSNLLEALVKGNYSWIWKSIASTR